MSADLARASQGPAAPAPPLALGALPAPAGGARAPRCLTGSSNPHGGQEIMTDFYEEKLAWLGSSRRLCRRRPALPRPR